METNHRYDHGTDTGAGKKVSTALEPQQLLLQLTPLSSKLIAARHLSENRKDKAYVHHLLRHTSNHLIATRESRSGLEEVSHYITRRRRDGNSIDLRKGKLDLSLPSVLKVDSHLRRSSLGLVVTPQKSDQTPSP